MMKKIKFLKNLFIFAFLIIFIFSCDKFRQKKEKVQEEGKRGRGRLEFPVETSVVREEPVFYTISAIGSVEAFETVFITSRVSGVADKVLFSEGKNVNSGDIIVEIDPERYKLAIEQAKAAMAKAIIMKDDAEASLKRRELIVKDNPGLLPGEEVEVWRTKALSTSADLELARVNLAQAELNLKDALVRVTKSGIIQTKNVQPGQFIQAGTVLATLLRREPMLLKFKVTQEESSKLQMKQKLSFSINNDEIEYGAVVSHIAASADPVTRMVSVIAEINNRESKKLRPGSFAKIVLPVGGRKKSVVIPQASVRPSENGFLVYVVADNKAVEKVVNLGLRTPDGKIEVLGGLLPGEELIIKGTEALRNGVKVIKIPSQTGN